ncbi:MAG: energy transducer TonB [Burkholderiaceae bacterium]|nr:energy transducer TonB [Oxalobacteraceae bacterium]
MRPSAFAVAIALHGALIALVLSGALEKPRTEVEPPPVIVQLLTPAPPPKPEPSPPEPPKPKPPKPEPPKPEPAKAQPRPEPPRPEQPKPEPAKPEPRPEPRPEPAKAEPAPIPAAAPAPAPVSPPVPAPAPPPAPAPTAPSAPKASTRTEVSISASYAAANRKPEYPKMSLRLGEQGTVVLTVMVKSDGSASDVEVKSSSGFARLDRAAADAVKTWRFNPATVDGKAIDKSYEVPITFKPPN